MTRLLPDLCLHGERVRMHDQIFDQVFLPVSVSPLDLGSDWCPRFYPTSDLIKGVMQVYLPPGLRSAWRRRG